MLVSQNYLEDGAIRIRNIERQLRTNADMENLKARYYSVALDLLMAAEELVFTTGLPEYTEMKEFLTRSIQRAREAEDVEEFKGILNQAIDQFFYADRNYSNMTIDDFRQNVNRAVTRSTPLNPLNIEMIMMTAEYNNRPINIFDPRCRDGQNGGVVKRSIQNSVVYGMDMEAGTAEKAKAHIDRVVMGTFMGSRISNDAFDILFMEPPVSWIANNSLTGFSKQEKLFLQNTIKYVRTDGIVVLLIPYFRMYKDMCVFVSKNLKDVQVRRLSGDDYNNKGLVAIVGRRSENKEPDEEIYRMLRRLHTPDEFPTIVASPLDKISLPSTTAQIETFRGSILDMDEMQKIVNDSGCMSAFWNKQEVEKLSENVKQPLLPFNIGQIGLVLTSGCLDGVVDEGDGHFHVIKGRVSKKSVTERDVLGRDSMEVNETISNRVEINVMLPNGEYKVLA